jgi:acetylornithine deacetylase/succinyl-diaminopimelate desuccinylase-like protein
MTETPPLTLDALAAFATAHRPAYEQALKTLVEIPSVSPSPDHRPEQTRVAEAAEALLRGVGAEVQLLKTPGTPMLFARLVTDPDAPAVTVYNHLDVQPANEPEWRTDPFAFVDEGGVYRARGATDDKGPALAALYGALAARQAGVPLNVRFLWETEEEIGSPNFEAGLLAHRELLSTESVVVSDTIWTTRGKPSTPAGLRGLQSLTITLETAEHDLHSGLVGGAARNPLTELAWLVGEMVDGRTGEVKIPGFYDEVEPPTDAEIQDFLDSGFAVETFVRDHHLKSLRTHDRLALMRAIWARPTLEIHGLVGGYTGPGIKSAVPPRAELKLSTRLVPHMRGARTLERITDFVKARIPDAEVRGVARLEPYRGHTRGALADAVKDAYAFAFGASPAFTREGGSIGAVPTMEAVLGAEVYFLGLSLPEHGYHAPNENFDWAQAAGGIALFARYFERLAQLAARARTP